jgi:RNA polymerase sigma factor (sigma-70 family)
VSFRPLADHELEKLPDEKLIAYIREASSAGDTGATRRGLAILVYGYMREVERRIALRVPREAVEDVAHEVLERAISSSFKGVSRGEFRAWLNTIVARTVADWFRRRERRPAERPLPSERAGSEEIWGAEPAQASRAGAIELQMVIAEVMADMNDAHRKAVELHIFGQLTAPEVCERLNGMTPDNVAQISSRFRRRLRDALAGSDGEIAS